MSTEGAMPSPTAVDLEHLRLLEISYYVKGGLTALFSCLFIFHLVFFGVFAALPESAWVGTSQNDRKATAQIEEGTPAPTPARRNAEPPPRIFFGIFAAVIGVLMVLGWTIGGLTIYAGRCIKQRKRLLLVFVMAGFNCLFLPYGTLLGVFTFLVLSKPHLKRLFNSSPQTA